MNYLQTNGRAGVKKGIILMTDGAANLPLGNAGSTGFRPCTAQAAVTTNAGDNNGYETGAANTCADDASSGSDANSGTGNQTNCTDSHKDRHKFTNFGVGPAIPSSPTPTVDGIEIRLDTWASSSAASQQNCVELSWDGGTSWTAPKTVNLGTSQATKILGSSADNWGHTWTTAQLSNANFVVRVTDVASNTATTFNLDTVQVNVSYHVPFPSTSGPCDYAATQSNIARAAGIVIFTIGYGIDGSFCADDGSGSPYDSTPTTRLLAWVATGANPTADDGGDGPGGLPGGCPSSGPSYPAAINSENADGDNFLCEAKGNQLAAVFQQAAQLLASGSRLVKVPF